MKKILKAKCLDELQGPPAQGRGRGEVAGDRPAENGRREGGRGDS